MSDYSFGVVYLPAIIGGAIVAAIFHAVALPLLVRGVRRWRLLEAEAWRVPVRRSP